MGVLRRAGPLLTLLLLLTAGSGGAQTGAGTAPMTIPKPEGSVRIAQYNAALNRPGAGVLFDAILRRDAQVVATGDIIRRVAPDVLLLNEFDRDAGGVALAAYTAMLAEPGLDGVPGIVYAHRYFGPSNTGVPSGLDLDGDGEAVGPGDAWGWGAFPGQYAMAVLSRFPLGPVRSWQRFPWSWVPGGLRPALPDGRMYY
ncbi:MAG: endonuclease/exonuclease/phosphatase family protein, partial [Pseudomonadota bacterium]